MATRMSTTGNERTALSPLAVTRYCVACAVRAGDLVVDATVGNGFDTEFLARLVGRSGRVVGFDIQHEAIEATRRRLVSRGLADRVDLLLRGHEMLAVDGVVEGVGNIRCAMFNLGYLPRGDKSVVTQPDTTTRAISGSCARLVRGGVVTVVVYPGHAGGRDEADAVEGLVSRLAAAPDQTPMDEGASLYHVHRFTRTPASATAPYAIHIRRA